jgi:hypothetical protein
MFPLYLVVVFCLNVDLAKMQCFLVMWNRVERVFQRVKEDLQNGNFVSQFRLSKLRDVLEKTRELTEQLVSFQSQREKFLCDIVLLKTAVAVDLLICVLSQFGLSNFINLPFEFQHLSWWA